VPLDIDEEILISGRYKFGANDLSIFRALVKVLEMIKQDYGIILADER
jgi:hypothetical protein